jgi:hypothetical protein
MVFNFNLIFNTVELPFSLFEALKVGCFGDA